MTERNTNFIWESQIKPEDVEKIDCQEYDPYDHFVRDPSGFYLLIKVNFAEYRVEVAVCDKDHKIIKIFSGRKPQDLYYTILKYEKQNDLQWFKESTHIAYLGKELKKAEIALATGNNAYFQE